MATSGLILLLLLLGIRLLVLEVRKADLEETNEFLESDLARAVRELAEARQHIAGLEKANRALAWARPAIIQGQAYYPYQVAARLPEHLRN